jgi:2'-5' RNA ligase
MEKKLKAHPDGTYIQATVAKDSADKLFSFVKDNKISSNLSAPDEYHTTITYSRKGIPEVESYKFKTPITAKVKGWEIFPTQMEGTGKCLVALIDSKQLTNYHNITMDKFGATYDFPQYKPHITISYSYEKDTVPKLVPDFNITYDDVEIKALKPDFVPKKADK